MGCDRNVAPVEETFLAFRWTTSTVGDEYIFGSLWCHRDSIPFKNVSSNSFALHLTGWTSQASTIVTCCPFPYQKLCSLYHLRNLSAFAEVEGFLHRQLPRSIFENRRNSHNQYKIGLRMFQSPLDDGDLMTRTRRLGFNYIGWYEILALSAAKKAELKSAIERL